MKTYPPTLKLLQTAGLLNRRVGFIFCLLAGVVFSCTEDMFQDDLHEDLNVLSQSLSAKFGKIGISDAANGGIDEFYFLGPTVGKDPKFSGSFHPDLSPVIEISGDFEFKDFHQVFTREDDVNRIAVNDAEQSYTANWDTSNALPGKLYRVRVRVGEKVLGFVDVAVVPRPTEKLENNVIPLVHGQTMQIAFRIEEKVCPARIEVVPREATISAGEQIQFVAIVYNYYGEVLDVKVKWSVRNEEIVTIDQNGLAEGIYPGQQQLRSTTVRAQVQDVFGAAFLDVFEETEIGDIVHDIDGNAYPTVKIGNQVWFAQDLKTTRYKDGTEIPGNLASEEWSSTTTGAYSDDLEPPSKYTNEIDPATEGRLYNWYAVNTGNLCPEGWRVPNYSDWLNMIDYLGGNNLATRNKLMSTTGWERPVGNNSSGFSAIPTGIRQPSGLYGWGEPENELYHAYWWILREQEFDDPNSGWSISIVFYFSNLSSAFLSDRNSGRCVRCIKQ